MVRNRRRKTDVRRGGWNYDSIVRALLLGGYSIHSGSIYFTRVSKIQHGKRIIVEVPWANKSGDIWKPTKWNRWLKENGLRVTSTGSPTRIVGPDG